VNIYDEKVELGYVEYKDSLKPIPLIFKNQSEDDAEVGRPAQMTTTWLEIVDGNLNGKYIIISQGARYYSFIYISKAGKKTTLNENLDAYNDDHSDCVWKY